MEDIRIQLSKWIQSRHLKRSLADVDAYDILKWTNKKYPIKKIYVTENGVAYNDSISSDCRESSTNTSGNILRLSDRPPLSECKLAPSGTLSPRNQYTLSQNLPHVRLSPMFSNRSHYPQLHKVDEDTDTPDNTNKP